MVRDKGLFSQSSTFCRRSRLGTDGALPVVTEQTVHARWLNGRFRRNRWRCISWGHTLVSCRPNLSLMQAPRTSGLRISWEVFMFGIRTSGAFLITLLVSAPAFAKQPTPAGHVKIATGRSFIVRQNTTIAAKPGDAVFALDTLRTEADGTIGVTMMDDTRISLGPASEVRLERYVFAPAEGGL